MPGRPSGSPKDQDPMQRARTHLTTHTPHARPEAAPQLYVNVRAARGDPARSRGRARRRARVSPAARRRIDVGQTASSARLVLLYLRSRRRDAKWTRPTAATRSYLQSRSCGQAYGGTVGSNRWETKGDREVRYLDKRDQRRMPDFKRLLEAASGASPSRSWRAVARISRWPAANEHTRSATLLAALAHTGCAAHHTAATTNRR